ncbi:MAG: YgjV family protein [Clostridiales bacterium]|nr:YgjV family protein [Clostridiales bacterium]
MNTILEWIKASFSNPINIIAEIIGILALILSFFIFLFNKRSHIIAVKTVCDSMGAIRFLLRGELVGGAINALNIVRNIVFSQKHKRWVNHLYTPLFFCILTFLTALLRWKEWYSFLPMAGSLLGTIGFWCSDVKNVRKFNLPAVFLWLIYGVIIKSFSTVLCNIFSIASIIIAMVKENQVHNK